MGRKMENLPTLYGVKREAILDTPLTLKSLSPAKVEMVVNQINVTRIQSSHPEMSIT